MAGSGGSGTWVAVRSKREKAVSFQGRVVDSRRKYLQMYQRYFLKKQHMPTSNTTSAAENSAPTSHANSPFPFRLPWWEVAPGAGAPGGHAFSNPPHKNGFPSNAETLYV